MKLAELKKACKEAKEELGFEEINSKAKETELKKQLTEVALLIGADGEDSITEDELDDVSKRTKEILLQLKEDVSEEEEEKPVKSKKSIQKKETGKKAKAKKQAEPAPEEEEEEDSLVFKITNADLAELKALIKTEGKETFPVASKGLFLQKNEEKLRIKALKDLGEEVEEEEKPAKEKKVGVTKGASTSERIEFLTPYIKKGKSTKKELIELLCEKFPLNTKSAHQTILADGKNPKYSKFPTLLIVCEKGLVKFEK